MPPKSEARARAIKIVCELGISSADDIDIESIAWVRGALVREVALEGLDGRLVRSGKHGLIAVKEGIPEEGHRRFVVAHELGHFELHRESSQIALCTGDDLAVFFYRKVRPEEGEANEFASELLLPEPLVRTRIKEAEPNLEHVAALAQEFRTSLTATAIRSIDFSAERCAVVVSERGAIRWYRATADFGYHLAPGTELSKESYAADYFAGEAVPREMRIVLARSWLSGKRVSARDQIKEQSWLLGRYESVLTLLWIYDHFDDDEEEAEQDLDHFNRDGKRWRW